MSRCIVDFSDPVAWDGHVKTHAGPDGGLLQSWVWGEVQRRAGRPARRLALVADGRLQAAWQVIEHSLPLGQRYWYAPRPVGEVGAGNREREYILPEIVALATREKAVFVRVDQGKPWSLQPLGFRSVPATVQPREELLIDVRPSAADLLAAMKPKTRYNIRLSQKHGVTVADVSPTAANVKEFFSLVARTAKRQGIRTHSKAYYETMVAVLTEAGMGRLLVASLAGTPLAAAFLAVFNGVVTYLHGGSSHERSEVMAPYALHWHALQLAKQLGAHHYNFGGVSSTNQHWLGITRFKQGFAPATPFTGYGGAWELPVHQHLYRIYLILQKMNHRTSDVRRKNGHRMSGK